MKTERKQTEIEKIIRDTLEKLRYTLTNTVADYSMVSVQEREKIGSPEETNIIRLLDFIYDQEGTQKRKAIREMLAKQSNAFYNAKPYPGAEIKPESYAEQVKKLYHTICIAGFWERICQSSRGEIKNFCLMAIDVLTIPFDEWRKMYNRNQAELASLSYKKMEGHELPFEEWKWIYEEPSAGRGNDQAVRELALKKLSISSSSFEEWKKIWENDSVLKDRNKGLKELAFKMMIGAGIASAKTFQEWKYVYEQSQNTSLDSRGSKKLALNKMAETAESFYELHTILQISPDFSITTPDGAFKKAIIGKMVEIAKTFEAWCIVKENAYHHEDIALAERKMMAFLKKPKKGMQTV